MDDLALLPVFGRTEVFGTNRSASKMELLTETVINQALELFATLLVLGFKLRRLLIGPVACQHIAGRLAHELRFFEVQDTWGTRRSLDGRVVSFHGDLNACFTTAIGMLHVDADHQVWVQIAVWFLHIEPPVDQIGLEELAKNLGG